ncbi:CheR family methyltransferase [Alteromonas ponticola]|uniref:Response regulator n=1 Tax=Alteromonas ponticola TaxID=2720613 RepID=A0ABX1R300_9ALTE|nr:CheR family methyltransferase [Alteromonas ponticola]NMH60016.1 response regulator [Alteromonas ponticola]
MSSSNTDQHYFWVGIGASAGGLEAIQSFCSGLPQNANMYYIVAQHLSPKHESKLTELIQRNTSLKVETIVDNLEAKPNVIYITPPKYDVFVEGDKIRLADADDPAIPKPSVNNLFVSLAEEKKESAIGVILSGTGTDGAHGIKMIRATGGITYAQDCESAAYDGMPRAATDTDCVDFVMSANEIGAHLSNLSSQLPQKLRAALQDEEIQDRLLELFTLVRKTCGVSFKQYKKATLQRRIERRMLATGIAEFDDYVDLLNQDEDEVRLLYKDILISVTNFFRDPATFRQLESVLQDIGKGKAKGDPIRLWVVGCATGEEAYSLSIMLAEMLGGTEKLAESDHQIFATDVDTDALTVARRGVYSEASMADVPPQYREKYFTKKNGQYEVISELKKLILFSGHNIIDDPPFMRVDLITCRNLLIYFEQELQKKVYRIFHYSLRERGYLFLGKSESTAQVTDIFRPVKAQDRIFQKRAVSSFNPQRFLLSGKSAVTELQETRKSQDTVKVPSLPETFVEQLGDASILINDNLDVEHLYGATSHYLKLPKGKPSLNLCEIVIETFKHEVRPLVFKVIRSKVMTTGQPRKMTLDGNIVKVRMSVYPVQLDDNNDKYLLVCFKIIHQERSGAEPSEHTESNYRIKELEDELSMAREHIQTVIEELETSNEELQSMNEELQSSNEELQSSNEELETTNEELQSTNEELVTMNDELNAKTTALEYMSNQLTNIKNSLAFPLVYVDKNLTALRANKAAREFFSLSDELDNFRDNLEHTFKALNLRELIDKVTQTNRVQTVQLRKGEAYYWLHVTPYLMANQSNDGAILSFIDNTELMQQKKALEQSRKVAHQASMAKSEFLANVSHEIRTPLNAIVGVNEVFSLQINDTKKRDRLLEILSSATANLKNLLNDLLDFAKLEAGQLSLEFTHFSVQEVISNLMDVYAGEIARKNLDVNTHIDKHLPAEFLGDPLRVQQIMANLLSNAIKFTERGNIDIRVTGQWHQDFYEVKLEVSDSGIGMSEQSLSKVFEKFTQADSSISRRFGGSGLGLSIVRELVNLMQGTVSVESEEGQGTRFIVSIPLKTPKPRNAGKSADVAQNLTLANINDKKVLIVEDNESNIFILESYLERMGVNFDVVREAQAGIEQLKSTPYALVLLDLQMDGMDGFEFFEQFKAQFPPEKAKNTKVIAVSAHVHNDVIEKCRKAGMDNFLPKPVEILDLHRLLKNYLSDEND